MFCTRPLSGLQVEMASTESVGVLHGPWSELQAAVGRAATDLAAATSRRPRAEPEWRKGELPPFVREERLRAPPLDASAVGEGRRRRGR
jgi:hypothetical protein